MNTENNFNFDRLFKDAAEYTERGKEEKDFPSKTPFSKKEMVKQVKYKLS